MARKFSSNTRAVCRDAYSIALHPAWLISLYKHIVCWAALAAVGSNIPIILRGNQTTWMKYSSTYPPPKTVVALKSVMNNKDPYDWFKTHLFTWQPDKSCIRKFVIIGLMNGISSTWREEQPTGTIQSFVTLTTTHQPFLRWEIDSCWIRTWPAAARFS